MFCWRGSSRGPVGAQHPHGPSRGSETQKGLLPLSLLFFPGPDPEAHSALAFGPWQVVSLCASFSSRGSEKDQQEEGGGGEATLSAVGKRNQGTPRRPPCLVQPGHSSG